MTDISEGCGVDFVEEQRSCRAPCVTICQRSWKIRLSTSSRNGHTRERLEVLRLVGGDDACVARVVSV